jgi:hypothetical protein
MTTVVQKGGKRSGGRRPEAKDMVVVVAGESSVSDHANAGRRAAPQPAALAD